jgi:cobalt-zinc-cadmium resistance protein CzcA
MQLRTLQDWVVQPRLLRVDGVADVVSYGGLVREIHVQPSPARLAAYRPHIADLEQALDKASSNAGGGVLQRGAEQMVIRSQGLFSRLDDIARSSVATRDGTPVLVQDVATVADGWAPRQGVVSRAGRTTTRSKASCSCAAVRIRPSCSIVSAPPSPSSTTPAAARRAGGALLRPDRSGRDDVGTVGHNLLEGGVLVTLVLFVFLLGPARGADRCGADPALAALGVHLPQAARHERRTCSAWARSTSASSSTAAW